MTKVPLGDGFGSDTNFVGADRYSFAGGDGDGDSDCACACGIICIGVDGGLGL